MFNVMKLSQKNCIVSVKFLNKNNVILLFILYKLTHKQYYVLNPLFI